ncbi:MAG: extracellular solute-binding protein [Eubacteriales bacterium]|nr:extracellular solute-binding protein [Eubacteriales bacterium]MDD3881186.1 extracellular solute-binding protein [Eubacteriales bacterium]MDD4511568.1 extracellular solute-binding protein [Eubacteriales bacterium]
MRKLLSALLALTMLFGMMSFAVAEEEPLRITIVCPFYGETAPVGTEMGNKTNPVLLAAEKLGNVELDITWSPQGDYLTKFSTVMASQNVPMVMVVTSGLTTNANYLDMCEAGVFWDLTEKIKERPFFAEIAPQSNLDVTSVSGHNYLFPAATSSARVGVIYRLDWLEKLGLEAPTNLESFKAMVAGFTDNDPDGNGTKDTIGFAYCDNGDKELTYAGFNTLACMLGAPNNWGIDSEGKLLPYFMFDEYYDTLDLFNWMYVNGYMNADFAVNTDKHGPLKEGVSGSMITTATNSRYPGGKYDSLIDNIEPTAKLGLQQILYKADGTPVLNSTLNPGGLGGILIPKASVKDEATLDRILDFIETLNDEGGILTAVGVEGVHYTKESDGTLSISAEQKQARTDDGSSEVFASMFPRRIQSLDYGQGMTDVQKITAVSIANEPYTVSDMSIGFISSDMQSLQTEISTTISDARVKYIMGQIDKDGFKAAVDEWLKLGGQQIIDDVNANYNAAK